MPIVMRPWILVKIFLISLLFLGVNLLFYWGLFSQASETFEGIAPLLEFSDDEAPLLISALTKKETLANSGQLLFMGDEIKTHERQDGVELHMGSNKIRLAPGTHVKIEALYFNPQPSYLSALPTLSLTLYEGKVDVKAFDRVDIHTGSYHANLSHAWASFGYQDKVNKMAVFKGGVRVRLKDKDESTLTEFDLPLWTQATFFETQLSSNFTFLKPSKLKKELKMSPLKAQDPWFNLDQDREKNRAHIPAPLIYSGLNYQLKHRGNQLRRFLTLGEAQKQTLWMKKADQVLRYWLGGGSSSNEAVLTRAQADWEKVYESLKDQHAFEQSMARLFFHLPWGELASVEFALKEALFEQILVHEGPVLLRDLIHQIQWAFHDDQPGRVQRFTEKWLAHWQEKENSKDLKEWITQFEMIQQLSLSFPNEVSLSGLLLLDQGAELLLTHLKEDKEFEWLLTQSRLTQVAVLIEAYRYDLAKDYLRQSYQNLPIAFREELSSGDGVFLEWGKLLAQRIEYAEVSFGAAPLPIDEEDFTRFVLQNRQNNLLSDDLARFLEEEKGRPGPDSPPLFAIEMWLKDLQEGGMELDEPQVSLFSQDPLAFTLTQARFKDLDQIERSFNALYFPLAQSFTEMEVEGEMIPGTFRLSNLSTALSLPQLLQKEVEKAATSSTFSADSFTLAPSFKEGAEKEAEELVRQLAFKQLLQAGFKVSSPQLIQGGGSGNPERVRVLGVVLEGQDNEIDPVKINFELDTSLSRLFLIEDAVTEEIYFNQMALNEAKDQLSEVFRKQRVQRKVLNQFHQALKAQPVTVGENSIRFLSETLLQANQVTLEGVEITFNAIFDGEKEAFISLSHPLFASRSLEIKDYIPILVQTHVDDFLKQNNLPMGGNWQIRTPFNRLKVSRYLWGELDLAFTLNLEKEWLENIQLKGVEVAQEFTIEQFKQWRLEEASKD